MRDYGTASDQIIETLEQAGWSLDEILVLVETIGDKLRLMDKERETNV